MVLFQTLVSSSMWWWGLDTFNTHSCLSFRSRTFGKCTRNVAGNSFPLATVSGNNTRTSSIKTHTDGSLQWRFDTQRIYEVYSCTFSAIRRYFISWTNSKTNWRGGEQDVTEETDSSGGRANAARFFRRDPVPYARWRWDGASAGTPQDSRLLCCSVCCFVFSSFGNAPMPQQSYSLYRKISLRKIFHCMFIMQV